MTFDRQRADVLIQKLGSEIVKGSDFQARPWTDIAVVVNLDNRRNLFGYVFWKPDEWEAAGPDDFTALRLAVELQDAMRLPGQEPWKKCLIRINRATGKIDLKFDYVGDQWAPNMADPAGFARSLRNWSPPGQ